MSSAKCRPFYLGLNVLNRRGVSDAYMRQYTQQLLI